MSARLAAVWSTPPRPRVCQQRRRAPRGCPPCTNRQISRDVLPLGSLLNLTVRADLGLRALVVVVLVRIDLTGSLRVLVRHCLLLAGAHRALLRLRRLAT